MGRVLIRRQERLFRPYNLHVCLSPVPVKILAKPRRTTDFDYDNKRFRRTAWARGQRLHDACSEMKWCAELQLPIKLQLSQLQRKPLRQIFGIRERQFDEFQCRDIE
jgi:hypothetical protein